MARSFAALARPSAAALLIGLGVAHLGYHAGYTLDDAYITFRYARNCMGGLGLVYNPGDYVKGYSNTLFTLLMLVPEAFGRDPIGASRAIGFASFAVLGVLGHRLSALPGASEVRQDRSHWLLALWAASTALAVHYSGGLETGLYTTLCFAAVVRRIYEQSSRAHPWSSLLFCLVIWSRPEGILIYAASAAHDALFRLVARPQTRAAELAFYLLPPLAYAGELAVSLAYYGAAFPQTYYAKARPTSGVFDAARTLWSGLLAQLSGASYLSLGLRDTGFGWIGLAVVPLALVARDTRRRNAAMAMVLVAQLVFVVRAGDDWAPAFRFGVPLLPFWFVLIVDALAAIAALARRYERPTFNLLGACALALCLPLQLHESERIARERPVNAENKLAQGRWFATLAEPGITLASFDIGGQGYAAGGFEILDSVGLTVRETTGCRDRMSPRCVRYAQLALPELVRLHSKRSRDAFVSRSVVAEQPYLALDDGKYLLARALAVRDKPPAELPALALDAPAGARLVAVDLPAAVRPQRSLQISLFWQRVSNAREPLAARALVWRSEAGERPATASESLLRHLGPKQRFSDDAIFADLITIETPVEPGRYQLQVQVGSARLDVGTLECQTSSAADETARRWLATARSLDANDPGAALRLRARAAELSPGAVSEYQRTVIQLATAARREAERLLVGQPIAALRVTQRAKVALISAYWRTRVASPGLRREIDLNAALRHRLVANELAALPSQ
jgi:hypothetical protein